MPVVTLTFTGSEEEIVSGIPRTMTIESNIPATIYFTLDGSTPTTDSAIYVDTFEFPTGLNSVVLSAFGVDGGSVAGPILIQTFAPNMSNITIARHVGQEGIVVDRVGTGLDIEDGWDADGDPIRHIDIEAINLDLVNEAKGYLGVEEGTQLEVNIPDPDTTPYPFDDDFQPFSTPEVGELFNPYAKMILIDNRKDNDLTIIPKPYGSLHNVYREFGGKRLLEPADDSTYISGGFVRRFYDARRKVMVSYYFDHNENRYVKNIQDLPENIPNTLGSASSPVPLVFKWLSPGQISGLT